MVCSSWHQRKHQSPCYWPFERGIQRWPVASLHKGPLTRKAFPCDDVIMSMTCDPQMSHKTPESLIFTRFLQSCPTGTVKIPWLPHQWYCSQVTLNIGRYRREKPNLLITMMTSSNGNIFRVTGPLCGEWRGALMFSLICASINGWVNNREAGDLRRQRGHYDVIVMTKTLAGCRPRDLPRIWLVLWV